MAWTPDPFRDIRFVGPGFVSLPCVTCGKTVGGLAGEQVEHLDCYDKRLKVRR